MYIMSYFSLLLSPALLCGTISAANPIEGLLDVAGAGRRSTHIPKSKEFYNTLTKFFDLPKNANRPVQLFTGSPKFWRRPKLQSEDVKNTKQLILYHNLSVYIHSIYLINLCRTP